MKIISITGLIAVFSSLAYALATPDLQCSVDPENSYVGIALIIVWLVCSVWAMASHIND